MAAHLLPHFTPSEQIIPHSNAILPPLAAQFLILFPPLNKLPLTLTPFYPHWQPSSDLISSPLEQIPLNPKPFYPPWQPISYLILPPLRKYPLPLLHHFTHPPPPLAVQLLHLFTPSEQITPHSYTILPPMAAQL